jgi:predicted dehydrogenase
MLFQLHFPGGAMANCATTYGAHQCRRYRVFTDKGAWFGMDPAFDYKGVNLEFSQARGKIEWKGTPAIEEKNQFALEMDHLAQCIYNNKEPFTRGEEGLQDQRIMEALYRSASEGKVVKLEKHEKKDVFRGTTPDKNI